jgi:catechol 2,3-dioxygenase-like lactoylglutathione lyase family enzyme
MARMEIAALALVVRDYDEALNWYRERLGFVLVEDTAMGGGKRWVVVAPPGSTGCRLIFARATGPQQATRIGDQTGGRVFLFLHTDDIERDHAAWTARGVTFEEPIRTEAYGRVAVFRDLYGNRWDLIERRSG